MFWIFYITMSILTACIFSYFDIICVCDYDYIELKNKMYEIIEEM